MKRTLLSCFLAFFFLPSYSQSSTWAVNVAPILYKNCTSCHNPNGIAPFSLLTSQDAIMNGLQISAAVSSRIMPPWPPDKSFRHYAHERILSQADVDTIVAWVTNGSPLGDTTLAPPVPVYSGIAEIANPDLVKQIPAYTVTAASDLYRCFVMPSGLSTQKFITEIEALPGNRNIVHHVLIFEDTSSLPILLDALDPGPGYTNFGGTGSNSSNLIGTWVPGQSAYKLPAGMGLKLRANTNIIIQVHYPAGSAGQTDSTQVRFKLVNTPLREVAILPLLNHYALDNGPLDIPADSIKTFYAHFNVPAYDVSFLSLGPHMHLIGKSIVSYGVTPLNDTIPLIRIPHWDFHWQGIYSFQMVQKIPAGTVLRSAAVYDNTAANPHNPNSPPQDVALGEATTDEMMLIFFAITLYVPGDEMIVIDSTVLATPTDDYSFEGVIHSLQLYEPYPNPANNELSLEFYLPDKSQVTISIADLSGRTVYSEKLSQPFAGINTRKIFIDHLSAGNYLLTVRNTNSARSKVFIKAE